MASALAEAGAHGALAARDGEISSDEASAAPRGRNPDAEPTAADVMGAAVVLASEASAPMTGSGPMVDGGWTAS